MTTPLKSVLVTDWSRNHIAGQDLDGGAPVSYELDTTIVGTEALGHDFTEWSVGDIATLKIDHETHLAQLRIVTSRKYILRVSQFDIIDIAYTTCNHDQDHGRHIYLKGTADNGTVYVMPMLGYAVWKKTWDCSPLLNALKKAQQHQHKNSAVTTQISHTMTIDTINSSKPDFKTHTEHYNSIFYSSCKGMGTVFDRATSFTVTTLSVKQTGYPPRAQMFTAAYVKRTKDSPMPNLDGFLKEIKGTAFSEPYFVVDGEKVFIRTNP